MPSGDTQRTCFPEMIVRLRAEWHAGMSMPTLISLRDELDGMLHRIRAGRNIETPIIICSKCGLKGQAAEPHVSVRALILALARFEITSKDQSCALEGEWAARRKSLSRRYGKLPTLKIEEQALPACEFRTWKAAINESSGVSQD